MGDHVEIDQTNRGVTWIIHYIVQVRITMGKISVVPLSQMSAKLKCCFNECFYIPFVFLDKFSNAESFG